jgi:hypothetical protein
MVRMGPLGRIVTPARPVPLRLQDIAAVTLAHDLRLAQRSGACSPRPPGVAAGPNHHVGWPLGQVVRPRRRAPLLPAGRGGPPDRGHIPVGFGPDDAAATPSQSAPAGDFHLGNVGELVDGDAQLTLAGRWQPSPGSLWVEQRDRRSTLVPNVSDLNVMGVRQVGDLHARHWGPGHQVDHRLPVDLPVDGTWTR